MDKKTPSPPRPTKIVRKLRKLTLSRETVAPLTREIAGDYCTRRKTGCPLHTC